MFCTSCGSPSPGGARFCGQCGHPLEAEEPTRRVYTPPHLVEAVLRRRAALEGERKHVTVLFCDIVDSVQLSAAAGAEGWHFVLDGFFRILSEGVHRFEGTINQYTGDGIMALFGAPVAHEDHVQRACHGALQIQEALRHYRAEVQREHGVSLHARIGINSGQVVVGRIGDDLRMDYTAQGQTVGLAARLQSAAEPDAVLLSEGSAALAADFFEIEPVGTLTLKGIEGTTATFRLTGLGSVQNRFGRSRARGLSPFVGREEEIRRLEESFADACREGRRRIVELIGAAGSGKSRLVHELTARYVASGARVLIARGFTHRQLVPLQSLADIACRLLDVPDDRAGGELRAAAARLGVDLEPVIPLIGKLLGIRDAPQDDASSPEARTRLLVVFTRNLLLARTKLEPTVLVVEDLEWMDRATRRILAQAVNGIDECPNGLLLVLACRTPDVRRWFDAASHQSVRLDPLDPLETGRLTDALLGSDPGLDDVRGSILASTGGNPLFIEEVVRSLAQSGEIVGEPGAYRLGRGSGRIVVPESVQDVLAARIDRLGETDKQVLHGAAIIGSEFSERLLRRYLEMDATQLAASLSALISAELIEERGQQAEAIHAFKHPLTREVAYGTQLESHRKRAHRRLAATLIEVHADALSHAAPLIAHHLESAGEHLAAARMWQQAAQGRVTSFADRTRYWRRVLECARRAPASDEPDELELAACSQLLSLGWTTGMLREEAHGLRQRGLDLVRGKPQEALHEVLLDMYYGRTLLTSESADAYCEYALRARRSCDELAAPVISIGISVGVAHALLYAGWPEQALRLLGSLREEMAPFESGEADYPAGFSAEGTLFSRCLDCEARLLTGGFEAAEPELRGLIAEAAARDQIELLVLPRFTLARGHWLQEDGADLREIAAEGLALIEDTGNPSQRVMANGCVGIAHLIVGDAEASVASLRTALGIAERDGVGAEVAAILKPHLSAALRGAGELDPALACAEEAAAESGLRRFRHARCHALFERGRSLRALGRRVEAERSFEAATRLALQTRSVALEARIAKEMGG